MSPTTSKSPLFSLPPFVSLPFSHLALDQFRTQHESFSPHISNYFKLIPQFHQLCDEEVSYLASIGLDTLLLNYLYAIGMYNVM